jgi:hypothetical protein
MLVDRRFDGFAAEEGRELAERAAVDGAACDVRPLSRVRALGEPTAELVERRPVEVDAVRVVVDDRDAGQYFEKWPCCSNASSPSEYAAHSERRMAR